MGKVVYSEYYRQATASLCAMLHAGFEAFMDEEKSQYKQCYVPACGRLYRQCLGWLCIISTTV